MDDRKQHPGDVSRRRALAALGCFGCSAWLSGLAAQERQGRPAGRAITKTIDVHSHFFPPSLEALSAQTLAALGQAAPMWSPALAVESMDRNGVATQIVGASWRPPLGPTPVPRRSSTASSIAVGSRTFRPRRS